MSVLPTEQMVIDLLAEVYPEGLTSKQIAAKFGCVPSSINRQRSNYRGVYSIPGIVRMPNNRYGHILAGEPEGDGIYKPITVAKPAPAPAPEKKKINIAACMGAKTASTHTATARTLRRKFKSISD